MTIPKPRFDGSINWGHVMLALTLLLTLGGAAWAFSGRVTAIEATIAGLETLSPTVRSHADWIARADTRIGAVETAIMQGAADTRDIGRTLTAILERLGRIETTLERRP